MRVSLFTSFLLLFGAPLFHAHTTKTSLNQEIDYNNLIGTWFEGINSPRSTKETCVVHGFQNLIKEAPPGHSFTSMRIYRDASQSSPVIVQSKISLYGHKLPKCSDSPDTKHFCIYIVGPENSADYGDDHQYEYVVVSNELKYPVTVLVRDSETFKQKYEKEVFQWLENEGFINGFTKAFNLIQPAAAYDNCHLQ